MPTFYNDSGPPLDGMIITLGRKLGPLIADEFVDAILEDFRERNARVRATFDVGIRSLIELETGSKPETAFMVPSNLGSLLFENESLSSLQTGIMIKNGQKFPFVEAIYWNPNELDDIEYACTRRLSVQNVYTVEREKRKGVPDAAHRRKGGARDKKGRFVSTGEIKTKQVKVYERKRKQYFFWRLQEWGAKRSPAEQVLKIPITRGGEEHLAIMTRRAGSKGIMPFVPAPTMTLHTEFAEALHYLKAYKIKLYHLRQPRDALGRFTKVEVEYTE